MSPATKRPTVDLDQVAQRCEALKLLHAAQALPELLEEASRDNLTPVRFLDRVLQQELERKNDRRIATSLKLSGLPQGKTLEGFDWTFQPRVDRGKLDTLATCAFIRQTDNVLFMGPPGVGKSHLAVALGVKAIKNGFSTQHYILDDLMHVLKGDAAVPPRRLRSKRYLNSALLVIDEVGFRPLDREEANLFFRLVSARYEKGSIILTSNKHVRDWPEIYAIDVQLFEPEIELQALRRPVIGGTQVQAVPLPGDEGSCTMTGAVVRRDGSGYNVFPPQYVITNSHCTPVFGQTTGTVIGQPNQVDRIGVELADPELRESGSLPGCPTAAPQCRHSDAYLQA